ncbi:hypothetical protein J4E86_011364 [Alternaria arbusti]|uniref:uncharacterized protein n=1 Tax=Alternaria arbusti TaxID=232088 RepID=UPI00222047E4|nr:uncharacterized protein J4E86_011364 [Alternaria arbusti]KAI4935743.1 hypothetical protein J4E86_011364 [Alternaria arbusti]
MSAIPIVVCGRNPNIAKAVREGVEPEYDVIHINLSVEEAIISIPHIILSRTPANPTPNISSMNYGQRPAAVALGGGFNDEMFAQIKASCGDEKMVWVRTDITRKDEMPDFNEHEAYGKATAQRLKKCLDELKVGKEGGETEGMYWF